VYCLLNSAKKQKIIVNAYWLSVRLFQNSSTNRREPRELFHWLLCLEPTRALSILLFPLKNISLSIYIFFKYFINNEA